MKKKKKKKKRFRVEGSHYRANVNRWRKGGGSLRSSCIFAWNRPRTNASNNRRAYSRRGASNDDGLKSGYADRSRTCASPSFSFPLQFLLFLARFIRYVSQTRLPDKMKFILPPCSPLPPDKNIFRSMYDFLSRILVPLFLLKFPTMLLADAIDFSRLENCYLRV